jgi:hypothetical protein
MNHLPEHDPLEREPDLVWRYGFEFLNREPIRGVSLREFGVSGGRTRQGLIGLKRAWAGRYLNAETRNRIRNLHRRLSPP